MRERGAYSDICNNSKQVPQVRSRVRFEEPFVELAEPGITRMIEIFSIGMSKTPINFISSMNKPANASRWVEIILWAPPLDDAGQINLFRVIRNERSELDNHSMEMTVGTLQDVWFQHSRPKR